MKARYKVIGQRGTELWIVAEDAENAAKVYRQFFNLTQLDKVWVTNVEDIEGEHP